MKRLTTLLFEVMISIFAFSQAPEKMSYQAVIRDAGGELIKNQGIGMQISILIESVSGSAVYIETQNTTTNANGLASIIIGAGVVQSGDFSIIEWADGLYFIKIETDPTEAGGINYTIEAISQLLSVPYALHAKSAETVTGTITETQNLDNVLSINNSAGNKNITNLADPVNARDAATKGYVTLRVSATSDTLFLGNDQFVIIPGISDANLGGIASDTLDPETIATANLVAYFPFNGNAIEQIASLTPIMSPNVTYVDGRRGQAYQGSDMAHLLYTLPANSPLKTLTSFSVATWIRSPLVTGDPEHLFFQIGKSTELFWGNLSLGLMRLGATADSLKLRAFFYKYGAAWSSQHLNYSSSMFPISVWMHLVYTYDGATSKFMIYKDGVKVTTNDGIENRWAAGDDVSPRPPLGNLAFTDADVINIGSWRHKSEGTATDVWMGWFRGNLDELRVYNKALSAAEITSLFQAEVSQLE